jgi:hypothetical protein
MESFLLTKFSKIAWSQFVYLNFHPPAGGLPIFKDELTVLQQRATAQKIAETRIENYTLL